MWFIHCTVLLRLLTKLEWTLTTGAWRGSIGDTDQRCAHQLTKFYWVFHCQLTESRDFLPEQSRLFTSSSIIHLQKPRLPRLMWMETQASNLVCHVQLFWLSIAPFLCRFLFKFCLLILPFQPFVNMAVLVRSINLFLEAPVIDSTQGLQILKRSHSRENNFKDSD